MAKGTKVDMELKQAFIELQEKQIETTRNLKFADVQIDALKRNKQHAFLTEKEINSLEEGTKTYASVGRMYVLTPMDEIKDSLQKKQTGADEKIKALESKKSYLENNVREATNSLRELVQQKKIA